MIADSDEMKSILCMYSNTALKIGRFNLQARWLNQDWRSE